MPLRLNTPPPSVHTVWTCPACGTQNTGGSVDTGCQNLKCSTHQMGKRTRPTPPALTPTTHPGEIADALADVVHALGQVGGTHGAPQVTVQVDQAFEEWLQVTEHARVKEEAPAFIQALKQAFLGGVAWAQSVAAKLSEKQGEITVVGDKDAPVPKLAVIETVGGGVVEELSDQDARTLLAALEYFTTQILPMVEDPVSNGWLTADEAQALLTRLTDYAKE